MFLVFDTETTGKPRSWKAGWQDTDNWPRLVQIGWLPFSGTIQACDAERVVGHVIRPDGFEIPAAATAIHGISHQQAMASGKLLGEVLADFTRWMLAADAIVGHNIDFDVNVVCAELARLVRPAYAEALFKKPRVDTMKIGTDVCKLPGMYGYKWPKLNELYRQLFKRDAENQHSADGDVLSTAECFSELRRQGLVEMWASR